MRNNSLNKTWGIRALETPLYVLLLMLALLLLGGTAVFGQDPPVAKYIILMIADGWGAKHIEATNQYCTNEGVCDSTPTYQDPDWNPGGALWKKDWISTYSYGGSYNTNSAWSTFNYVLTGAVTDSAAAASVLYTGVKTDNSNVSVSHNDISRLFTIGEKAKDLGKGVGAVSTVPLSDATPGAWVAHNNDRSNAFAIADEGFFGDPNTTGTAAPGNKYEGHYGSTMPPADVLIGDARSNYVNSAIRTELQTQHNLGNLYYVNCPSTGGDPAGADGDSDGINDDGDSSGVVGDNPCIGGNTVNCDDNCVNTSNADQADSDSDGFGDVCDCQQLLMSAAYSPGDMRIAGLFERPCTDLAGCYINNPTLSESLTSALTLLGDTTRFPNGAILMFEGGAVDWAGHGNDMESLIVEMRDFNDAVDTVITWVNDGTNGSDWSNTMVIVTGDHECGYLTPKFGIFPDQLLGLVNNDTIKVTGSCATDKKGEKIVSGSGGRRASWNDLDCDNVIDGGETVYWAWNSGGHSNSLIPLYCRGVGCNLFSNYYEATQDLKRGFYLDNRHVWSVMNTVLIDVPLLSDPTVTNIDTTSAALGATIDYDSESTITERGTVWDVSSSPVANQLAEGGTAVGVFSHNRTGLPEGSLIYNRGYAVNSAGTGYSPEGAFYTEPNQASNVIMSTVSDTSMHISWTDNSANSSEAIILVKAGAPVDAAPVDGSPYIANSVFGSGEQLGTGNYVVFAGTGSQVDVTGLTPWTIYHVAVYAYAGAATMINYQQSSPAITTRESCTDVDGDTYAVEGGGCGLSDCNDNNIMINPAATETCNNIDDNCNGTVDENLTQPTSCGVGACAATGIETCTAGVWGGDTCTPGTPTAETCNNIDDNCNGTVDENLTQPTSCGVGACAATGFETCNAGVWGNDTCIPGTPTAETCNNIDDNCNGTVDENLTQPTSCGVGACAAIGIETCTAGVWGNDTCTSGTPTAETCNNIDDNCNGTVDEGLTQPTSCGVGACAATGFETCNAGVWGNDTCIPGTPTAETCNNIDDNCNGTVDEDLTQPTSCGVGACAATGIETCTAGGWGGDTCTPGTPTAETCNNIDDNCNGTVDENLTQPTSCGVGACAATGIETCTAGVWGGDTCTPGTPTAETCNNIDDNCNGTVDENLTQPTSCGVGACAAIGIETCTAGEWGGDTCTPGTPTAETCNNIDDNCNGTVDEDLTQPTSCGVGACAATGIETCTAGEWGGDTCTPGTPTAETCNNIDDNCNGTVDEDLTQPTSCGVGACAATGIETCTAGGWGGDTCTPGTPTAETCNNIDDNCNGTVDENLTQPTSCGVGACAATGIETCTAGVWGGDTCTPGTPTAETCNNIDDNCNGTVDEDLTQPTSCGVGACAATGIETCTAGVWGGDTCTPGTPTAETCNNIDDNCNGTVDENLTQPTSCGVGACAATGIETCTAGVWGGDTCTPGTPTAETCNNIDDNCNGTVDEGLTGPIVTTVPPDGETGVPLNSSVKIIWDKNVNCATVNATNILSDSPGWEFSSCSDNQAVFATSGQSGETTYTVTVTTAVTDTSGCAMEANYQFSFRTNVSTTLSIIEPDGLGDTVTGGDPYLITYSSTDPDNVTTAAFYYDTDNADLGGTVITGACSAAPEGVGITCTWDTAGMTPGVYYVYGITNLSGSGTTHIWTGGGTGTLASNAANWSGNSLPQNGDDVIFNGTSIKDCNWDIDISIHSISLNPGYKGTVDVTSVLSFTGDSIISDGRLTTGNAIFYDNGQNVYSLGPITIN